MKLVLLPGLDGTGELFAPFVQALRVSTGDQGVETEVIVYPPDQAMSYAEHEAWARERLPRDEQFVLLAESFSGPVGIAIAASAPSNLKGLILCATFASNPLPLFGPLSRVVTALPSVRIPPALFEPFLYAGQASAEVRRLYSKAMAKVSPRTLQARVAAILAVDHSARLRRIEVPILYLQAKRDRLIPRSAFSKMQRLRQDIGLIEFDAPHFLLQTQPQPCAGAVIRFIRSVQTDERPGARR
jgi:pimeloyl-ACP methyl ester carboxylesterase